MREQIENMRELESLLVYQMSGRRPLYIGNMEDIKIECQKRF